MGTVKLILFTIFCFFTCNLFSQTKTQTTIYKNYHYTFNGVLNAQSKTDLETSVLNLNFAKNAKIKYKAESNSGELFLSTEEKIENNEGGNKGFDITQLKKLIIAHNLTPLELTIIEN
jgi:hypothetical protein